MRRTADAVVVGGGIHGCAIAYELAARGLSNVVLLERRYLAGGATGRSAAGVRHQFGTEVNILLSAASIERFGSLADELGYSAGIDFVQGGYLMLAYGAGQIAQLEANARLQKSIDPTNQTVVLSPEEVHDLCPHLQLEGLMGASFNPEDGHLNPWHATHAYARAAQRLGVEVLRQTQLVGLDVQGDAVIGARTSAGFISTPVIVDCAGPHARNVALMAGIDIPVEPQRHQILVTEPVGDFLPMMVISFAHGTYFKQTPHGSVLMGYGDPDNEVREDNQDATWQFLEEVVLRVSRQLPLVSDLRVVRQWAGAYDMTPDSQAILGGIDGLDGFFVDAGWSGHGLQMAPAAAQALAELIHCEQPFIKIDSLRSQRFEVGELTPEPACV